VTLIVARKIVTVNLPESMVKFIDSIANRASSSRADFIRHAIRFCFENRICIDSYLTHPSEEVEVREVGEKKSSVIKRVEVIGGKTYGYSG
jgi:Arc/MetJ-type ribon-helix-helix transcriptional regulator